MSSTTTQYGFFFDQSRCIGCQACAVACKSWNQLSPGPTKWLRVFQWETGTFPDVKAHTLFAPCYHCENPVCVDAANGAMYKEPKYGAVLIDPAQATSANLKAAWQACPYGAIVFDSDAPNSAASKCTMCVDRLEQSLMPVCVMACPMRALDFGKLSDLQAKYGNTADLEGMPSSSATTPAVVVKPMDAKKALVPYDAGTAIGLLGKRGSLPPYYTDSSAVTSIQPGTVTRDSLKMKPSNTDELMRLTQDNAT